MTTAAALDVDLARKWSATDPYVQELLAWVRSRGRATADEIVEWDRRRARRLFTWDEAAAAELRRLDEARMFLNRFRAKFEGMRVRAFIHIKEDADQDIFADGYRPIEAIAIHPGMRAQVIANVTRRMATLAGELRMWALDEDERRALFDRLRSAISGAETERP